MRKEPISAILLVVTVNVVTYGQVEEARQAMDRGEAERAVRILSDALASRPTPEVYLELGLAYDKLKDYQRAEEIGRAHV